MNYNPTSTKGGIGLPQHFPFGTSMMVFNNIYHGFLKTSNIFSECSNILQVVK
jgi:hypothetical protein